MLTYLAIKQLIADYQLAKGTNIDEVSLRELMQYAFDNDAELPFQEALNATRILLASADDKLYEIASAAGLIDYQYLIELFPVEQGPRYKNEATRDVEVLVQAFLTMPNKQIKMYFNFLDELEIVVHDKIYNLTEILKHNPDFDQLEITDSMLEAYAEYMQENCSIAQGFKELKNSDSLSKGEKNAIYYYTQEGFKNINTFLRQYGQLENLKKMWSVRLCSDVKILLTTSAIIAGALSKLQINTEVVANEVTNTKSNILYRHEKEETLPQDVVARRKKAFEDSRSNMASAASASVAFDSGFTSTSQVKDLKGEFGSSFGSVNTHYIVPQGFAPNIKSYSILEKESEILFPLHQEFIYFKAGDKEYGAFPVRSIQSQDPFSYSSEESRLRSEILKIMDDLNLGELTSLRDTIDSPALLEIIDDQINLLRSKSLLIARAQHVYDEILSKPYQEDVSVGDEKTVVERVTIYRNNHGLAHVVRCAMLVEPIIKYLAEHANDKDLRLFCQQISPSKIEEIEIAMLYTVAGRESEAYFQDYPDIIKKYKKMSGIHFAKNERENFTPEVCNYLAELVESMCDPTYYFAHDNQKGFMWLIMSFIHNLDLMRCYDEVRFESSLNLMLAFIFEGQPINVEAQRALYKIYSLASQMLINTNDRILASFKDNKFVEERSGYGVKFIAASTNAQKCASLCNRALKDIMPSKENKKNALASLAVTSPADSSSLLLHAFGNRLFNLFDFLLKKGVQPQYNRAEIIKSLLSDSRTMLTTEETEFLSMLTDKRRFDLLSEEDFQVFFEAFPAQELMSVWRGDKDKLVLLIQNPIQTLKIIRKGISLKDICSCSVAQLGEVLDKIDKMPVMENKELLDVIEKNQEKIIEIIGAGVLLEDILKSSPPFLLKLLDSIVDLSSDELRRFFGLISLAKLIRMDNSSEIAVILENPRAFIQAASSPEIIIAKNTSTLFTQTSGVLEEKDDSGFKQSKNPHK